jgi:ABC-type oligopeptide transport system ATPase subunit
VNPLLRISQVSKTFRRGGRVVKAVDDVSLDIMPGETVGLIGESGSGKSTLGRIALMLIRPDEGVVTFDGEDLAKLPNRRMRGMRARIQVVFQEPYESLNPQMTLAQSIAEPLRMLNLTRDESRKRIDEALDMVGLSAAMAGRFPDQLSGGQQQRVGIARAIVTRPQLIVLDEPTSSLDLSVRAGVIRLLQQLQSELGMAYLFISHDLATVEYVVDRAAVMHHGAVVEEGPAEQVISNPQHPYTASLIAARLSTDPRIKPASLASLASMRVPAPRSAGDATAASVAGGVAPLAE